MHAEKCPVCDGEGKYKDKECHGCKGAGWVNVPGGVPWYTPYVPYVPYVPADPWPWWEYTRIIWETTPDSTFVVEPPGRNRIIS